MNGHLVRAAALKSSKLLANDHPLYRPDAGVRYRAVANQFRLQSVELRQKAGGVRRRMAAVHRVRPPSSLAGGLFVVFVLTWSAAIFFRLLRISGLFPGHVSGIEVILAFRILAGLLLIGIFVVCH
ncbi:MAG: hypothetical protein QHD01_13715 [Bradyrhizobium sp.]|uniref:hypothetical protein n=1 Tax=Bradyrhizobium sp. TaxID=376 RepID=UPI0029A27825|nr:hypothetical protein [Bradyrhizobium sp.]MDX3967646.1 hypothetical protein [Bradyrhizobium sp.]